MQILKQLLPELQWPASNSGQDCTAATRVLVQEGVYEEMVKLLANQATNEIAVGMPNEDVLVGPVNNAAQFERVKGFLDRVPSHAREIGRAHV